MKKTKKILSIILAVMMILTAVPLTGMTAFAVSDGERIDPGKYGLLTIDNRLPAGDDFVEFYFTDDWLDDRCEGGITDILYATCTKYVDTDEYYDYLLEPEQYSCEWTYDGYNYILFVRGITEPGLYSVWIDCATLDTLDAPWNNIYNVWFDFYVPETNKRAVLVSHDEPVFSCSYENGAVSLDFGRVDPLYRNGDFDIEVFMDGNSFPVSFDTYNHIITFECPFEPGTSKHIEIPFVGHDYSASTYYTHYYYDIDTTLYFNKDGTVTAGYSTDPEEPAHEHSFSKEWTKNETAHWHECTAKDCDIKDYATSTVDGVAYGTHTWENGVCTVCGYDNTFVIDENGVLVGYNGNGGDVVIPDGVTSIGKSVFEGCENLTSVKIPDSVTSIGEAAFMFCEKLENVTLPDGVTSIGISAFNYSGLKSITIPESVTSIGNSAFSECSELISVTLPNGLKSIENETFFNCLKLTNVNIPDSVESIGDSAFGNCTGLKNVIIPNSVKSIGVCAFNYCKGIESITISDNVTEIKAHAFWYCENLEDVYVFCDSNIYAVKKLMQSFGDYTYIQLDHEFTDNKCRVCGIMEFDIIDGVLYGYYGKGGDVVIPDGVTGIKGAFSNCSSVTSVTIPNSVTSIGVKSFENCVSLTSVVIPCSVKSIGDYAFESCVSLSSITISGNIDIGDSIFDDCGSLVNVYCNCDSDIESVKAFMEDFGRNMFTYTQLEHTFVNNICSACGAECAEFVIEDGVLVGYNGKGGDIVIPDGVTGINDCAFSEREDITSVTIPDSVKSIDAGAFEDCTNLISVTLPNGLKAIENETFMNCINLKNVTIPDSVESIGDSAFGNCTGLKNVIIPNSVKSIGVCAFNYCKGIESITISDNVTEIKAHAFWYCENLEDVYVFCDSNIYAVKKLMQSFGDYTYIQLDHNFVDGVCTACGERNKISGISVKNGAQLTDDGEMIYGLDCGLNSAEDYFDITDNTLSLSYNKDIIGTGAHINIERDGKIIAYYVAVIFGDVNGDGWYDGMDSVIVNCLSNGLLSKEQIGEAEYMAADCNHDGVIDSFDVDILNQAGVLLADVDQTKSEEELLETSSAYVEYLNLIDQTVETETTEVVEEEPVDPGYTFNFFDMILNLIKEIITVIKSVIAFFK